MSGISFEEAVTHAGLTFKCHVVIYETLLKKAIKLALGLCKSLNWKWWNHYLKITHIDNWCVWCWRAYYPAWPEFMRPLSHHSMLVSKVKLNPQLRRQSRHSRVHRAKDKPPERQCFSVQGSLLHEGTAKLPHITVLWSEAPCYLWITSPSYLSHQLP